MEIPGSLGDWLRQRRKQLDLTQEELAQRAGCSVFALRKIESGERKPSKQLAGLLGAALEIPEKDLPAFIRIARGESSPDRLQSLAPHLRTALPSTHPPVSNHIDLPLTPLLGRESELAALERLFKDPQCRLLTLTGMGGIGKTRMALEFGCHYYEMFPDGVFYVPLAAVNSVELIIPAIADAFEFAFSAPVEPKQQLIRHLQDRVKRGALLILDNLEHLIASAMGTPDLVAHLLIQLPHLKILTTSRERLNLRGEWMYELHGLPVPPAGYTEHLDMYGAVQLFVQSARRIKADFDITESERPIVAHINRMLDGIPLAIELAAAWVGMLSLEEIACEIEANIDFLESSMQDIPERHRSMRASFDHSWMLLSEEERIVLCRLSVFRGGFDRFAAENIAGATLPRLSSLASKSLVRHVKEKRYDLHEVIRQFALARFEKYPSQQLAAYDAHCSYYLKFAAQHEKTLRGTLQQQAVRDLNEELDNIRAAWIWAIHHQQFALLGSAVRSLSRFFEVTGLIREGIQQFEPLVRVLKNRQQNHEWYEVLGQALTQQGVLYFRKGLFDQAQQLMEQSLSILRSAGKPHVLTDTLVYLGIMLHLNGDVARSRMLMKEGLVCAQAADDEWFTAYAIYNLGYLDSLDGLYAKGYAQMQEAMTIWRKLGDPHSIALGLNYLGTTLLALGRYEEAEQSLDESLRLCDESGNRWGMGTALRYLGLTKMSQGQFIEAQSLFRRSIETFGDYIVGWDIARSSIYLAEAIYLSGDTLSARQAYMESLSLAQEAHSIPLMLDALKGIAQLSLQAGAYERAFELSHFILHHTAATREAKDSARQIIHSAGKQLDKKQGQAIRVKAQALSLDEMITALIL